MDESTEQEMRERFEHLLPRLNEKERRRCLGFEAERLGRGGISKVSGLSGVHRNTVAAGVRELRDAGEHPVDTETAG